MIPDDELDALIARITPSNLHPEVDTGPAVGAEVLDEEESDETRHD